MFRPMMLLVLALAASLPTFAQVTPFPPSFRTEDIDVDGATIHVRIGGKGPAVVLLHGFADTGDMWVPLAADLARDHTVVVPDLRGMGLSSYPEGGYDKRTQAADVRAVLAHLGVGRADVVAHDIGNMVAFAYAVRYPELTTRLALLDAPVPGIGPWEDIVRNPKLWHFDFGGPDAERLVAGRERIFLDRFYNEFSGDPARITEETRAHYAALYARPGAMRSSFAQFAAFRQDAKDNKTYLTSKLSMPVLAIGGEASFGAVQAAVMREAASDVTEVVIPKAGHWLMEEAPTETTAAVRAFLDSTTVSPR